LRVTEFQLLFTHAQWETDRVLAAAASQRQLELPPDDN